MADKKHLSYIENYFSETRELLAGIDREELAKFMGILKELRSSGGRLFIAGIGGSAATASHAVNDFRKIAGIETYSPCDNFAEFSAWANDDGWKEPFSQWLRESRMSSADVLMVLSVGGGSDTTSQNLVAAMQDAREVGAGVVSIVSRDGGKAKDLSDCMVHVPVVSEDRITPHAEGLQGVILHLVVNGIMC